MIRKEYLAVCEECGALTGPNVKVRDWHTIEAITRSHFLARRHTVRAYAARRLLTLGWDGPFIDPGFLHFDPSEEP